jgi:hypothetical protein
MSDPSAVVPSQSASTTTTMIHNEPRSSSLVDENNTAMGAAKAAARPQLQSESSNPNMNGPLYMQTSGSNRVLVRRLKRKEEGTWKTLARWFVENQIGMFHCHQPRGSALVASLYKT